MHDIFLKTENNKSVSRYPAVIAPRQGDWIQHKNEMYEVIRVTHRVEIGVTGDGFLYCVNVDLKHLA